MSGINLHEGTAVPLDIANIDTDQIIPKQFLTGVTRSGYGKHLFHDWRYNDLHEQEPNPDFNLNKAKYQGASILVTRENFGCGSSREHAPWALLDFGLKVIIAPSFADIFYGNAINNSMLPIKLDDAIIDELMAVLNDCPETTFLINLSEKTVSVNSKTYTFEIAEHHQYNLINGLDAIGQTLEYLNEIETFENQRPAWI
ncbi:MAG: 3-isopropylmalate dehydratase small subunit [Glaciecola sp.]|jgi:3-isopropylmalate/(R)-2-methylmalate dehydratase small subunit